MSVSHSASFISHLQMFALEAVFLNLITHLVVFVYLGILNSGIFQGFVDQVICFMWVFDNRILHTSKWLNTHLFWLKKSCVLS